MIRNNQSWSVCISSDFELNFLIYAANVYGLIKEEIDGNNAWPSKQFIESDHITQKLESQWKFFWDQSIQKKVHKNSKQASLLGLPNFEAVDQQELRESFIKVWPSFISWWYMPAGGNIAMNYWEDKPDIISYVKEFEDEVGREIKTFNLNIDLIYMGGSEPIEVNEEYVIMPIKSDYLVKKDWWINRFKERY